MHVLAFDLGLTRAAPTAAALVRFDSLAPSIVWARALRPAAPDTAPWAARVSAIGLLALETAQGQPCELLAYEAAHYVRNLQTLRKLAALEGVILLIAAQLGLPVLGIQPAEGKVALASDSRADNAAQIAAARRLCWCGTSSHEADAIGVALAAEAQHRRAQLLARRAA